MTKKFTLEIICENDAFNDEPRQEVARILRTVAAQVLSGADKRIVYDSNGNSVGLFVVDL